MPFITLLAFLFASPVSFAQDVKAGEALYQKCILCHGKEGQGDIAQKAPKLAGQFDWYIETQLKNFKSRTRKNSKMDPYLANLSEANFKDLAAYISKLK